jgi:hypothetical protein
MFARDENPHEKSQEKLLANVADTRTVARRLRRTLSRVDSEQPAEVDC